MFEPGSVLYVGATNIKLMEYTFGLQPQSTFTQTTCIDPKQLFTIINPVLKFEGGAYYMVACVNRLTVVMLFDRDTQLVRVC